MTVFEPRPYEIGWRCPCALQCGAGGNLVQIRYTPVTKGISDYRCPAGCLWQHFETEGHWHYLGNKQTWPIAEEAEED